MTNIKTKDETLAKESNKETDTETVTEKSLDAEMVTESFSSKSKNVQDEANRLRRSSRIRKKSNQLMYHHTH